MLSRKMREITCFTARHWISEGFDRQISGVRVSQLSGHLEYCSSCRDYRLHLESFESQMRNIDFPQPPPRVEEVSPPVHRVRSLPWMGKFWVVFATVVVISSLTITIYPQIKLIWEVGKLKDLQFFHESRSIIERSIQAQLDLMTSKVLVDPAIPTLQSRNILETQHPSVTTAPQWLDQVFKGKVTRLLMEAGDTTQSQEELLGFLKKAGAQPAKTEFMELKPGGLLFDFFIEQKQYSDLKKGLQNLKYTHELVEMSYKPWDGNKTRVVLWVAINP